MNPHAPTLLELQRAFSNSLLHSLDGEASVHVIADGLNAAERLDIYRNTSTAVLMAALRLSFPAVQYLVGPEFFEGAARLFAAEAPPRSAWLDEYGAGFPEFLAKLPQAASLPYLSDVARLEWKVNIALHATDVPPLDVARLARLNEDELAHLPHLRFEPHPAAQLLRCEFPADVIWHAVLERDDNAMAAIDPASGPAWLLVQRIESGIDMVRLDECQWHFTAALFFRHPLSMALQEAPCADAHDLLAALLARGCFADAGVISETSKHQFRRIPS